MYYIGVDLGGTNIAVGIVNEDYKIVEKGSVPTKPDRDPELIIKDMAELCGRLLEKKHLIVSPVIEKKGRYGLFLIFMGLLMVAIPLPMVRFLGFGATALFLSLYSFGYKGAVPLSDSLAQRFLGERRNDYGKVRVAGSIGYVVMTLLLQYFVPAGTAARNRQDKLDPWKGNSGAAPAQNFAQISDPDTELPF